MKTLKKLSLSLIALFLFNTHISSAQSFHLSNSTSTLKIEGTSNIHDWHIIAEDQQGTLVATIANNQISNFDQLDFSVKAESLKSGKGSMDKNTYKALNTNKYKNIVYKLSKVKSINCAGSGSCKVSTLGSLTISGTTKTIEMVFDVKFSDSKIILSGNKTLNMTDFGVEPPTALLGTITTGENIDVIFKASFIK